MTEEAILKCLDVLHSNIRKSYFARNVSYCEMRALAESKKIIAEECRKAREKQREEKSVISNLKKLIDRYEKLMENAKDLIDHVNDHPGGNYPCEYNLADVEETRYKILCEVIGDLLKEVDNSDQNRISDGWIPCSKRLPLIPEGTDSHKFIVMIYGADEPTILNCDSYGTWFDDDENIYDVIAWYLFQEPYTE